jgi:hypothetical protein
MTHTKLRACLFLRQVVDAYDNGRVGSLTQNNILFQIVVPFIGFVHSSDLPGLANTGHAEQRFLSAEYQNASDPAKFVPDTFFGPNAALDFLTAFAKLPPNALDTLNPNLVAVLRETGLRVVRNANRCSCNTRHKYCPQHIAKRNYIVPSRHRCSMVYLVSFGNGLSFEVAYVPHTEA